MSVDLECEGYSDFAVWVAFRDAIKTFKMTFLSYDIDDVKRKNDPVETVKVFANTVQAAEMTRAVLTGTELLYFATKVDMEEEFSRLYREIGAIVIFKYLNIARCTDEDVLVYLEEMQRHAESLIEIGDAIDLKFNDYVMTKELDKNRV